MDTHNTFRYLEKLTDNGKAEKNTQDKTAEQSFLCVLVQKERLYIPLTHVKEIIPSPQITAVGHTKPWLEGILKAHGEIYSVVNLARFLDNQAVAERSMFAIALAQEESEGNYAIIVNNVLGIVKFTAPKQVSSEAYKTIYQGEDEMRFNVLAIPDLIESSEFTNVSVF